MIPIHFENVGPVPPRTAIIFQPLSFQEVMEVAETGVVDLAARPRCYVCQYHVHDIEEMFVHQLDGRCRKWWRRVLRWFRS